MERIELDKVTPLIAAEHLQRYRWATSIARGRVLDAACGVGYGAPILQGSPLVREYVGLDRSKDALDIARREYSGPSREFVEGDTCALPFADGCFDTVVSLETLEHLQEPSRAIAEFRRVLVPGGVLLGSVPAKAFEEACADAYGPNEYHAQVFDDDALRKLIHAEFNHALYWDCWLQISGMLQARGAEGDSWRIDPTAAAMNKLGSVLFAASMIEHAVDQSGKVFEPSLYPATSVVLHERLTIRWRNLRIENDAAAIRDLGAKCAELEASLQSLTQANVELRAQLVSLNQQHLATLNDSQRTLDHHARVIEAHEASIRHQSNIIAGRDGTIDSLREQMQKQEVRHKEELERIVGELTTRITESQSLIKYQAEAIDTGKELLARARAALEEKNACISNQTLTINMNTSRIEELMGDIAGLRANLMKTQESLAHLRHELQDPWECVRKTARALRQRIMPVKAADCAENEERTN